MMVRHCAIPLKNMHQAQPPTEEHEPQKYSKIVPPAFSKLFFCFRFQFINMNGFITVGEQR